MKPPPLPSTSLAKQDVRDGDDLYSTNHDCLEDSGFFEDIVQQQGTTSHTLNLSAASTDAIFGREEHTNGDLRRRVDKAFQRCQAIPSDNLDDNGAVETSKIMSQSHMHQVLGKHGQEREYPDTLPPSSAHHEAGQKFVVANHNNGADTDSEARPDETIGTSIDYEDPSSPEKDKLFERKSGQESQTIPQASTAGLLQRALGEESQDIPEYERAEQDADEVHEELQPLGSKHASILYRGRAGEESQVIPTMGVTEQHRKQLTPEPQDFHDSDLAAEAQDPLEQAIKVESQVLPPPALQDHLVSGSSAAQQVPVGFTPTTAQFSFTSSYTPRQAPRSSLSPQVRKPATQRKRTFSETTRSELSVFEDGSPRTPLQLRFKNDNDSASEVSSATDRNRASTTRTMDAADDHIVDDDTVVVNMSQNTRSSKRRRVQVDAPLTLPSDPKVVFSLCSIQKKTKTMESFYELGGKVVDNVAEADILCVPDIGAKNGLKKTPKLLLAIILGKAIVTEKWIVDCHRRGRQTGAFPDPASYIPLDTDRERSWQFNLIAAIKRGRDPTGKLRKLLDDWKVYVTTQLHRRLDNNWDNFRDVALKMGARNVYVRLPTNKGMNHALVLGDEDDFDAVNVVKLGYPLYKKDLLTMAVLRGKLDLDSAEFELDVPVKDEPDLQD